MTPSTPIDPPLDGFKTQSFPEASRAMRAGSERIMARWLRAVRNILPAAEHLTLMQLRDHVPLMVEQIAAALASDRPAPTERLAEGSKPHGEVRFHQAYSVDELLIEYHLLRCIILEEVAAHLGRVLTTAESVAINVELDTAQRQGIVTFVEHLTGQLKASDDLQSNYISYLNHDLRGGMNGIMLMVEVLKRQLSVEPRFAEAVEDLDAMRRSVLDSVTTMDRFVFAHRLGRRQQQARYSAVNVKSLVHETVQSLSHVAMERHVEFAVEVSENCAVESDRDLLRLILQNLLGNTIKHARREGGHVKFCAEPQSSGGCLFTIGDDGPGIGESQLDHLYISSSSSGKGTQKFKLGLPVSKMAADLVGATLAVESVVGKGTVVRLAVPDHGVKK